MLILKRRVGGSFTIGETIEVILLETDKLKITIKGATAKDNIEIVYRGMEKWMGSDEQGRFEIEAPKHIAISRPEAKQTEPKTE